MGAQLGRYTVLRHLASGGMADVLLARADGIEGFERHVVIKRILPQFAGDQRFIRMFLDEARVAATLHHQNIVHVHDIGEADGEYFLAMEYVHGEDARKVLARAAKSHAHMPLDCAIAIVAGAAAGLHHAHERCGSDRQPLDIVHRDVTPSNILVGYDGSIKLVDFGIATATAHHQTQTGSLKGKFRYMSPEQCKGQAVDRRTDVYSLGVVLYELATTKPMIRAANDFLTMQHVVEGKIVPPQARRPDLPSALADIIMCALANRREDRYASCDELRRALEHFATSNGLTPTHSGLATYMRQQFGERLEPWLEDSAGDVAPRPRPSESNTSGYRRPVRNSLEISSAANPDKLELLQTSDPPATSKPQGRWLAAFFVGTLAMGAVIAALLMRDRDDAAPPVPPPATASVATPAPAVAAPTAPPPDAELVVAAPTTANTTERSEPQDDKSQRIVTSSRQPSSPPKSRRPKAVASVPEPARPAVAESPEPAPAPVAASPPPVTTPPVTTPSPAAPAPPPPAPPSPPAAAKPQLVSATVLEANRTSGNKSIVPDPDTQDAIRRSGSDLVVSAYKVCVASDGAISSVARMRESGFPPYDEKIMTTIRRDWRYKPFVVNGKATAVCTAIRFAYSQK